MTRINVVPVDLLSNSHLMAEYKELSRIATYVIKHGIPKDVPSSYRMGAGHVKFFTNKLSWLYSRYLTLYTELRCRGYNLDRAAYYEVQNHILDARTITEEQQIHWEPTPPDYYVNMKRLGERGYS